MIGEKSKVDNQAITEGSRDRMPTIPDTSEVMREDKDRRVVTVNINLGGSSSPQPPGK